MNDMTKLTKDPNIIISLHNVWPVGTKLVLKECKGPPALGALTQTPEPFQDKCMPRDVPGDHPLGKYLHLDEEIGLHLCCGRPRSKTSSVIAASICDLFA